MPDEPRSDVRWLPPVEEPMIDVGRPMVMGFLVLLLSVVLVIALGFVIVEGWL